jgi:hypothetical protein
MPDKTLYDVLGVPRNAKATDIGRAYNRIRAEMQKEDAAPNPRLAAQAKVAYDTLYDPQRREAYDATLEAPHRKRSRRGVIALVAGVVILGAAAFAAQYFQRSRTAAAVTAEKSITREELVEAVAPRVGRVHSALISGEVRDLGAAVSIGEDEMVTTCRGVVAGAQVSVVMAGVDIKAEPGRVNEELDVCTLRVKRSGAGIRIRGALPGPNDRITAIAVGPTGLAQARDVRVGALIDDPKGKLIEIRAAAPLDNGTPLFDAQGRLAALVVAPNTLGEGRMVALPASRIVQTRGATAVVAAAPATPGAPESDAAGPAPVARAPIPASASRGTRGVKTGEGFATLWKEDDDGRLVEVLDDAKTGQPGVNLAYWTQWTGRDAESPHLVHCLVTGTGERVIVEYDDNVVEYPASGYWYCAVVGDDADSLVEGPYRFAIFVDGQEVAAKTVRVEKKFFTRGTIAVIVVVLGLALLGYGRRNKIVSYADASPKG